MKTAYVGTAVWLLCSTIVHAGGVERSNQFLGPLFEPGNYLELSYGHVSPSITGADLPLGPYPGGERTGDIASSYNSFGFAYKHQFNDAWSAAIILDQPFGADLAYPTSGSINLGGTGVVINNTDLTGIIRFAVPESGFGVHAGLRGARTDGSVTLGGASFGPVNGYRVDVDRDTAYGWLAGVSWERPDIAARVSLTYNAVIEHDFDITESGPLVDPDGPGPAPALPLLDLLRFRSGLLRAMVAKKETGYGSDTQRRVQARCGSHRAHQRSDTAPSCVGSWSGTFDDRKMDPGDFRRGPSSRTGC